MRKTIISHDVKNAIATIKFAHKGVKVENTYNLMLVEPSLQSNLKAMGLELTEEMQHDLITKLQATVKNAIESGMLK